MMEITGEVWNLPICKEELARNKALDSSIDLYARAVTIPSI